MDIDLSNMKIARVAIHTIHKRTGKSIPCVPTYATQVFKLPPGPAATVQNRITESLGESSHGVEITFIEDDAASFLQISASLLHCDDPTFLIRSQDLASRLAWAQCTKELDPCKLFVASGTCGVANRRYLLVIKADMQDGFTETAGVLNYLTELFLTSSQKLFKIGMLVEVVAQRPDDDDLYNIDHFQGYLFDHLLNALETRAAAQYFYAAFLGAQLIVSDKSLTKQFYDHTCKFINSAPVDQSKKIEWLEALRVDLRSNSAVIKVDAFAKAHLPKEHREAYVEHMDEVGFTRDAVTKNVEFVNLRLKRKQRMKFEKDIEISAPADTLHSLVKIESQTATETILKIKSVITLQE